MSDGNPIPTKARKVCKVRDEGRCVRCGLGATDLHHRARRREGGHGYENLVSLCRTCHDAVHKHPAEARATGYIVSVHGTDIAAVPIKSFYGWLLFTEDGEAHFA